LRTKLDKLKSIPLTRTIKPYMEPLPNLVTWSDATLSTAGIVAAGPSVEAARYVPLDEHYRSVFYKFMLLPFCYVLVQR